MAYSKKSYAYKKTIDQETVCFSICIIFHQEWAYFIVRISNMKTYLDIHTPFSVIRDAIEKVYYKCYEMYVNCYI